MLSGGTQGELQYIPVSIAKLEVQMTEAESILYHPDGAAPDLQTFVKHRRVVEITEAPTH